MPTARSDTFEEDLPALLVLSVVRSVASAIIGLPLLMDPILCYARCPVDRPASFAPIWFFTVGAAVIRHMSAVLLMAGGSTIVWSRTVASFVVRESYFPAVYVGLETAVAWTEARLLFLSMTIAIVRSSFVLIVRREVVMMVVYAGLSSMSTVVVWNSFRIVVGSVRWMGISLSITRIGTLVVDCLVVVMNTQTWCRFTSVLE